VALNKQSAQPVESDAILTSIEGKCICFMTPSEHAFEHLSGADPMQTDDMTPASR
jgi:hypothetical protein